MTRVANRGDWCAVTLQCAKDRDLPLLNKLAFGQFTWHKLANELANYKRLIFNN
jgi:hypothetical protein